jgi:predicted Zn-dependent protease
MSKEVIKYSLSISLLLLPIVGCSNGGSSGGGGGGLGGTGMSLGQFIPGQAGQYADAGAKGFSTLKDEDEDQLGQSVVIAATNRWPLFDKAQLTKYVTEVGLTLATVSSNPDANWTFGILDTPEIGAYSGPNGYIMITRGAIASMEDESELAGVLAHEIGHCVNQDGVNTIKATKLKEAFVQAGTAAIKDPVVKAFGQNSDLLTNTVFNVGWNQPQETKADSKAVQILIAAGYDAGGLARYLSRAQTRGGAAKAFGTHPGIPDRINRITSQINNAKPGATNKERFTKAAAEAKL